jgi:hypothetical protein
MLECWKNGIGKNGRVEEWKKLEWWNCRWNDEFKNPYSILQRSNIPLTEGEK